MLFCSFDEAWSLYLTSTSRLPPLPEPVTPQRIAGLAEIMNRYQVIAFDAYGVLHNGGEAFPAALRAVALARQKGIPVCVVTNDVTHHPEGVAEGLRRRGFDFVGDEVVSGRTLLAPLLRDVQKKEHVLGLISSTPDEVQQALPDHRFVPLGRDPQAYEAAEGILFIDNNTWEEDDAAIFMAQLQKKPRPIVVCNPDIGCPFLGRVSAEPGYYAHQAAENYGISPIFLGKPFPEIYHALFHRFPGVPPSAMLMVGDSPHTDVLGSRGVGMDCLLVETGFLQGQDSIRRCHDARLFPQWIAAHL